MQISDNPVVRLNHAVAMAMVHGPAAGLVLLDELRADERIADDHRYLHGRADRLIRCDGHIRPGLFTR
jgi:predicted RNA polymerase sigma factor